MDCPHAYEVYDKLYDIAQQENNEVYVIFKHNGFLRGNLRDDTFCVNWFFEDENIDFEFWDFDVEKIEYYDDDIPKIFLKI